MDIYVLLDRTGSMARRWDEAVNAVNVYVQDVVKAVGRDLLTDADRATLAVFDRHNGTRFDVLRDAMPLTRWTPLAADEVLPRGDTPLLDAVVRMAALAEAKGGERAVVVVMTDGEENASTEATRATAKAALDRLRAKNWQVVFLGADFDAFAEAGALGTARGQTISTPSGHYANAMHSTATRTAAYRSTGATMNYTDQDRKDAGEDEVTGKTGP